MHLLNALQEVPCLRHFTLLLSGRLLDCEYQVQWALWQITQAPLKESLVNGIVYSSIEGKL